MPASVTVTVLMGGAYAELRAREQIVIQPRGHWLPADLDMKTTAWLTAIVLALTSLAMPGAAWSQSFVNGNMLWSWCGSTSSGEAPVSCTTYIMGVSDGEANAIFVRQNMNQGIGPFYCFPSGVTAAQIVDVARKYMAEHPEQREYGAANLVVMSLTYAFPCEAPPASNK